MDYNCIQSSVSHLRILFITFRTKNKFPYFDDDILLHHFIEQIHDLQGLLQFNLYAYAIMPDHIHILLKSSNMFSNKTSIRFIAQYLYHNINYIIGYDNFAQHYYKNHIADRVDASFIVYSHFQKKLNFYRNEFKTRYSILSPYPKFSWQKPLLHRKIKHQNDFMRHIELIFYQSEYHSKNGTVKIF